MVVSAPSKTRLEVELRAVLGRSVYFGGLSAQARERLVGIARYRQLKDGQMVYRPGMPDAPAVLVMEGGLRVACIADPPVTLAVLNAGSYHNIGAAIDAPVPPTEVYALGPATVAELPRALLKKAADEDVELRSSLTALAFERYHQVISFFIDIASKPLEQRLARRLLGQSLAITQVGRGAPVEIAVTQSMLAEMLATSRSQVSECLAAFERRGILERGYRKIVLRDLVALYRVAGEDVKPL